MYAFFCASDTGTCFVFVPVVHGHVLYCDSGRFMRFLMCQWYVYMFCIVTVVSIHVLYFDSGTCACFVLCQW